MKAATIYNPPFAIPAPTAYTMIKAIHDANSIGHIQAVTLQHIGAANTSIGDAQRRPVLPVQMNTIYGVKTNNKCNSYNENIINQANSNYQYFVDRESLLERKRALK
ncbi:Hypothetical_protein [Hexamita inflata]|uniref:Hypothetical_protein n=1 Tax=Hexamita inflata TaxID=28002 RepID=A0ABP1H9C9_9EUKA